MIPYYSYVITKRPDVDILVYSGDADLGTCPGAETTVCLKELEGTPIHNRTWAPWFVNGATAGYVEQYEEFSYATIKGAGSKYFFSHIIFIPNYPNFDQSTQVTKLQPSNL